MLVTGKIVRDTYLSIEAQNGQYKKESDLYSLGIILLELDNYATF